MTIKEIANLKVDDVIEYRYSGDVWTFKVLRVCHVSYNVVVLSGPGNNGIKCLIDRRMTRREAARYILLPTEQAQQS